MASGFARRGERSVNRLFLLRHAKAGWALPGMRDFDRPLDASGHADAEATGAAMRDCGYVPDITLCSNAKRARETLEGIAGHTDTGRVLFFDRLYSTMPPDTCRSSTRMANSGSVLVIGHNPMMEDLAMALRATASNLPGQRCTPDFRPRVWR